MKQHTKNKILILLIGLLISTNLLASDCNTPTQLEITNFLNKLITYHNDKTSTSIKNILSKHEYQMFKNNENNFWLILDEIFNKELKIKLKSFPKSCDGFIGFSYRTYSEDRENSSESNLNFIIKKEDGQLLIVETQVAG